MSSTPENPQDRVLATAAKRQQLLSIITATEDTAATLHQVKLDLATLKNPWYDADALYSDLCALHKKEQKEFDDLRDSHIRKFFGGSKYQERLTKEEEDVTEVLEWQAKADKTRKELKAKLDAMKEHRDRLEQMVGQRTQAQNDLDELYASVYDGPSPEDADEDACEAQQKIAQQTFDPIQARLSKQASVVNYIALARSRVDYAASSAARALGVSQSDILDHSTGGRIGAIHSFSSATADQQERFHLSWVRRSLAEASQFLALAYELDPEVRGFVMPKVADGKSTAGILDEWINTPVTDYLFHREIEATAEGIAIAGMIVDEELRLADEKVRVWSEKRDAAGEILKAAREQLYNLRAQTFESAIQIPAI
ncbi:hypothetical protein FSPOR_8032 [Fusarium sporotrichioides]|uniref:Uncharacterized protein n=1 Tax=Fusarium sporotrichioides TaxID=5514 RepID=A0A395RVS1_FUSSP|nr:hypothetical protein FSPOR_8032 [Fusarium sporotrichioides]